VVLAVVSAGLPTLTVLVSLPINNQRLSDFEKRMDQRFGDLEKRTDQRFGDLEKRTDQRFGELRDLLRSEIFRIEQVLDVRLKHVEHA
jgi:hypothetical protein